MTTTSRLVRNSAIFVSGGSRGARRKDIGNHFVKSSLLQDVFGGTRVQRDTLISCFIIK